MFYNGQVTSLKKIFLKFDVNVLSFNIYVQPSHIQIINNEPHILLFTFKVDISGTKNHLAQIPNTLCVLTTE